MVDGARVDTPEGLDNVYSSLQGDRSVLRRAGQSLLDDNLFEKHAKMEAQGALSELEEFQQRIREQTARCWGQYHATAEEIRAQQERDAISELVTRELDRFKDEQKRKEEAEEERLRHLYRGIWGKPPEQPKPVESHYSGYPPERYVVQDLYGVGPPPIEQHPSSRYVLEPPVPANPTCYHLEVPSNRPIISSVERLITTPCDKNYRRLSAASEDPRPTDGDQYLKLQQRLLPPEPSFRPSQPHSNRNRSSREGRQPKRRDDEVDEIERLLKLNQNRLKRLDCLRF